MALVIAVVLHAAWITPSFAQVVRDVKIVARSGDEAPGLVGSVLENVQDPVISSDGFVAFAAQTTIGSSVVTTGIWRFDGTSLELVAYEGQQAPGLPATTIFGGLGVLDMRIANQGAISFQADLLGPSDSGRSLWKYSGGDLSGVLREGQEAGFIGFGHPNIIDQLFITTRTGWAMSRDGFISTRLSFSCPTCDPGVDPTEASGVASLVATPVSKTTVLRTGDANKSRAVVDINSPVYIADGGFSVFSFVVRDIEKTPQTVVGYAYGIPGVLYDRLCTFGEPPRPAVGANPGDFICSVTGLDNRIMPNNSAQIFFRAFVCFEYPSQSAAFNVGFWRTASDPQQDKVLIAHEGMVIPTLTSTGVGTLGDIDMATVRMNDDGKVAFVAKGAFGEIIGIYITDDIDQLVPVANTGSDATGLPSGYRFSLFLSQHLNSDGQLAFLAEATHPSELPVKGVWVADHSGELTLVLSTLDEFDFEPNPAVVDLRTIWDIHLNPGQGATQGMTSLSDTGKIVVALVGPDPVLGVYTAVGILDSVICATSTRACAPDINGDGFVDVFDFVDFGNLFSSGSPEADFNCDGVVDLADFLAFLNAFDAGC
ncbi:MAG: hypothetical protein KIT54_04590 [Phycisphaeraceae bacterium]|nr:hypothetical protein [Phycisphaeraceae bacterium]